MTTRRGDDADISSGFEAASRTQRADGAHIPAGIDPQVAGTARATGADIASGMGGIRVAAAALTLGDELSLNGQRYRLERVLSKSTGEAEIYLLSQDGVDRVLKLYYPNFRPKEDVLRTLKQNQHDDIINVVDYGYHHDRFFEVMDYARGGTLEQHLPIRDMARLRDIVAETVNGYHFCHARGIVHKDIKPGNLYCRNEDGTDILIGDFGISSALDAGMTRQLTSQSLTVGYAAPEMYGVGGKVYVGKEVDYYALGITVIHLWDGRSPFHDLTIHVIANLTSSGKVRIPEDMPREFQQLVKGLITADYTRRWGYDEVQRWLRGEDVPVHFRITEIRYPPLQFGQTTQADTPEALVQLLKHDPDRGRKLLYSGKISAWVNVFDHALAAEIDQVVEVAYPQAQDAGLQRVVYLLDPDEPFTQDGRTARTAEELGGLLDDEFSAMVDALADPHHAFYLFLEAHEAKAEAATFRHYFRTFSRKKALNTIILELLGRDGVQIGGVMFRDAGQVLAHPDRAFLARMLKDKDSRLSLWLDATATDLVKQQLDAWRALKKCDEATLAYVRTDENGVPQMQLSQARFDHADVRIGARFQGTFTVRNTGGGVLSGPLISNKRWLTVQPDQLDPARPNQDITFTVNARGLPYGASDIARIELQTNIGVETVEVALSIEAGVKAAARFRWVTALLSALAGAILGLGLANLPVLAHGWVSAALLVGLAAVIASGVFWCVLARRRYLGITLLTWIAGLVGIGAVYRYYPPGVSILGWAILWGLAGYAGAPLLLRYLQSRSTLVPAGLGLALLAISGALAYVDIRATRNLLANWDPSGVPPEMAEVIASFEPAQDSVVPVEPPVPIVDKTIAPCCDGRQVPLLRDLTLYARSTTASKSLGSLKKGALVRLKAQEVHFLTFPRCEVRRSRVVDTVQYALNRPPAKGSRRLRAGEIYALLGENMQGQCRVWHDGVTFWTSSCPTRQTGLKKDRCEGGTWGQGNGAGRFAGKVEFWEQMTTPRGTTGWAVTQR